MKTAVYRKNFLRIAHIWFAEDKSADVDADIFYVHGLKDDISGQKWGGTGIR